MGSFGTTKLLNASVAHDLRTPITVLKGYLDYLEDGIPQDKPTEDKLLDTVLSMQGAVTRLEQYAECVRNIEKIESIEIKIQPENVKLLIKEIESNISQLTGEKEILFSDGISFDEVNIDKGVLFRILENLLQNALRYAEKQINISISQNDKFLILTVKDDGKGFTETDLKKADTMFYSKDREKDSSQKCICYNPFWNVWASWAEWRREDKPDEDFSNTFCTIKRRSQYKWHSNQRFK